MKKKYALSLFAALFATMSLTANEMPDSIGTTAKSSLQTVQAKAINTTDTLATAKKTNKPVVQKKTAPADSLKTKVALTKLNNSHKKTTTDTIPTAVDNSEKLLLLADSLARMEYKPTAESLLFLPIVFYSYSIIPDKPIALQEWNNGYTPTKLDFTPEWSDNAGWQIWFERTQINRIVCESPWLVPYNISMLPEPPKEYKVTADVKKNKLVIQERRISLPQAAPENDIKKKNWIHSFSSMLQFSQSYLSENWYQGGTKNLNAIGNIYYNLKLNQTLNPNTLFEMTFQYKLGLNSAPDDELRDYAINEDLLQFNTKFGIKATKKFYYSMNLQFKTQVLNNYETNTYNLKASILTPGELNAGVGMTYSTANSRGTCQFDASLSPLSYNMKICKDSRIDPSVYGIENGKRLGHEVGSSSECKVSWTIVPGISLSSRWFVFSDYSYLQSDLETSINFSVNKYISTQIYAHLRFDDSANYNDKWKYWQFKEILSFGLQYRFNM